MKKSFFQLNYRLLKNKKIKKYFLFSTYSFLVFFFLGLFFAYSNNNLAESFFVAMSQKYIFAVDYNFIQLFFFIFKNNLTIALFVFLSGIIFGLPTFFVLALNSFVIGLLVLVGSQDVSLWMIIFSLLPHGIFEIPAILLALSLGFFMGDTFFNFLFKDRKFKNNFLLSLKIFLSTVLPLLFVAAFIESLLIIFFK